MYNLKFVCCINSTYQRMCFGILVHSSPHKHERRKAKKSSAKMKNQKYPATHEKSCTVFKIKTENID